MVEWGGLRQLTRIRGVVPQGGGGVTRGVQKGAGVHSMDMAGSTPL